MNGTGGSAWRGWVAAAAVAALLFFGVEYRKAQRLRGPGGTVLEEHVRRGLLTDPEQQAHFAVYMPPELVLDRAAHMRMVGRTCGAIWYCYVDFWDQQVAYTRWRAGGPPLASASYDRWHLEVMQHLTAQYYRNRSQGIEMLLYSRGEATFDWPESLPVAPP